MALCEVVERAMARDREDRYPDARAMRIALLNATNALRPSMVSSVPEGAVSLHTSSAEFVLMGLQSEQIRLSTPTPEGSGAMRLPPRASTPEATAPTVERSTPPPAQSIDISLKFDLPDPAKDEPASVQRAKTPAHVPLSSFPPPPRKKSGGGFLLALLVLSLATTALAIELTYEGGIKAAWVAVQGALFGTTVVPALDADGGVLDDAGVSSEDGGMGATIRVRLRQVPDDATVTVDGQVYPPSALPALRSGEDRVITILVRRRAEPFDIRVEAPGMVPFLGRRWASENVSYRLHFERLPDAGTDAAGAVPAATPDAGSVTQAPEQREERSPRRRRRRR
jgi:hypothetical protein